MKQTLIALALVAASGTAAASCIGNDTHDNLRVIFAENLQAQGGTLVIDKTTYKKILAPKEEDCFPDYHPDFKKTRSVAFMPVLHLNHPSRNQDSAVIYYLAKPLPDFASVVVHTAGANPRVSVAAAGRPVPAHNVLKARVAGK
jgi:hypothetical protein